MLKMCRTIYKINILVVVFLTSSLFKNAASEICNSAESYDTDDPNNAEIPIDVDNNFRSFYAAQMLSFMNLSIDPCDDFYEYACGNWKNVIRPRQSHKKRNYLSDIEYELNDIVAEILKRTTIVDVAAEYEHEFQLAKQFHHDCLQTDLTTMRKSDKYLQIIKKIGGFPAVDSDWNSQDFSWINMSAHMSNYALKNLIEEGNVPQYPFKPYFSLPTFGFDIELHHDSIEKSSSNAYQTNRMRMRNILALYDVAENDIDSIVDDIFDFLKAVLKVYKEFDEDVFKCEALATSENEEAVTVQWQTYFEIAWMGKVNEVDDDNKPCSYFYSELDKICKEHNKAVANYLALKFLYHMDAHLKDVTFQNEYCVFRLRQAMKYLFDHLYMKLYINNEALEEVKLMIKDIRNNFRQIINEADWLDEETREAALLKESYMGECVGRYEDAAMTERLLDVTKKIPYANNNYELNNLNLKVFQQYMGRYNGLHAEKLNNDSKPLQLLLGMQANAFYYNIDNTMYVMAGVLHPPIFHKSWPNAMKYATLGFLIGHELTHAFDTLGSNYDHVGELNYWWTNQSGNLFDERAHCFVDYFDNYYIPEINRYINGNKTRDENIADAGGIRLALLAYRNFIENARLDGDDGFELILQNEQMPGLDLAPEQLFFLSSAQLWCSSYEEPHYWQELADEHTVDKYRALGIVSNNPDFANAFSCPLGSAMNPSENKCAIW